MSNQPNPDNLPTDQSMQQGNYDFIPGDSNHQHQQTHDPRLPSSNPSGYSKNPTKASYAQELREQIRQKQEQKYKEMVNDRQTGLQAVKNRLENDPFGRQGAGAPLRDIFGNIITIKNKALANLYQYPNPNGGGGNQYSMEPAFSLKARLARENIVSQSVGDLRTGIQQQQMQQYPQELGGNNQNIGNFYPPQNPGEYPGYPQANPYYPPYGMPQYPPVQEQEVHNPLTARLNHRKGNSDITLPYPQPDDRDVEAKQKKMNAHILLQNDLLRQMEEKKMKKAQEEMKKKMEEELEEIRVRKENEAIRLRDQQEADKKKKVFQNFQQENQLLANNLGQNSGVTIVEKKKTNAKRTRTPIEDVVNRTIKENITNITNINNTTEQTTIQEVPLEEFPYEVGKQLQMSVESQLSGLKRDWEDQQISLHHQLLDLKKQLHQANQERAYAHDEIGELKNHLRNQQITEEIKRTQLYNALLKGQSLFQMQQSILPTVTRLEDEKDPNSHPFEFPKGRNMYKMNDEEGDVLDAMLAANSKIVKSPDVQFGNHGRLVERINSRPASSQSNFDVYTGLDYLNYYNSSEDHNGIKLDDNVGTFDLPDFEKSGTQNIYFEDGFRGTVRDIYQKNKERLEVLEDLESKGIGGGLKSYREPVKKYEGIEDEIYQMIKSDGVEDNLLNQINNPRRYGVNDY